MWFVVDEIIVSETATTQAYLGYVSLCPSRAARAYTVLMRANQPKTAVCHLLGLLCAHLFSMYIHVVI